MLLYIGLNVVFLEGLLIHVSLPEGHNTVDSMLRIDSDKARCPTVILFKIVYIL